MFAGRTEALPGRMSVVTVAGTSGLLAEVPDAGPLSIVVLPFANATGDPRMAQRIDALCAAVTTDLSRITGLYVVPGARAFALHDQKLSLQRLVKEAGVQFALKVDVKNMRPRLQVELQLIHGASGVVQRVESLDADPANPTELQEKITSLVGGAIAPGLQTSALPKDLAPPLSSKANDLRMSAMALKLAPQSVDNWQQIETLQRLMLKEAPEHPVALSELAFTLASATANAMFSPNTNKVRELRYAEARALALKALQQNDADALSHAALGICAQKHGELELAKRSFERQLALAPKDSESFRLLGEIHTVLGNTTKAIEVLQQAVALNARQVNEVVLFDLGVAFFYQSDADSAISWFQKALDANPNFTQPFAYLAMAYAQRDDMEKAMEWATWASATPHRLASFSPPTRSSPVAYRDIWEQRVLPAWRKAGLPTDPTP